MSREPLVLKFLGQQQAIALWLWLYGVSELGVKVAKMAWRQNGSNCRFAPRLTQSLRF
jgi:hypothetical protein